MIEAKIDQMLMAVPMESLGAKASVHIKLADDSTMQAKIRPTDPVLFIFARWSTHPRIVVGFPIPLNKSQEEVSAAVIRQLKAEFEERKIAWSTEGETPVNPNN